MKRIYKIGIIIVGVILIVAAGYFIWQQFFGAQQQPTETTQQGQEVEIPTSTTTEANQTQSTLSKGEVAQEEEEGVSLSKISDDGNRVFDFWVGPQNQIYYITVGGEVYRVSSSGDSLLSEQEISALNDLKPSPNKNKALISFGDPKNPNWGIFDTQDNVWRPLPQSIVEATWGRNNTELIAIANQNGSLNLVSVDTTEVSNQNGLAAAEVLSRAFRLKGVSLKWSETRNSLLITEPPASFYNGKAWSFSPTTENLTTLMGSEGGLWVKWQRDGIAFKYQGGFELIALNHNLQQITTLGFAAFPSKCSASETDIVCGGATNYPPELTNFSMPDSYFQGEFFTVDEIRRVDRATTTNKEILLRSGTDEYPALDIQKPETVNSSFYFINRYDKGLYRLNYNNEIQ